MTSSPSSIVDTPHPVLAGFDEVVAAYLFGSAAKNHVGPDSDIDIAVLLDEEPGLLDRKALQERLLPPLCRALRGDVHLLLLNHASCLARAQVFSKGELLFVRDHAQVARFRMKSYALCAEFAPYLEMSGKGYREKTRSPHGG